MDTDVRKVASWQVEENITEEILDKKINELVASRGRKNTDPREVLRKLEVLSKSARPLGKKRTPPYHASHPSYHVPVELLSALHSALLLTVSM